MRPLPFALASALLALPVPAQNSTEKVRPEPGPLASRAGSAVPWRADLASALREAKESEKPVFWYVPTIAGSFMDRRPELDRAMKAGPFSWPRMIDLLAERFVPVELAPDAKTCAKYGLKPIEFIEPGFLVLSPEGEEIARQDRLSTHHPLWYESVLAPLAGAPVHRGRYGPERVVPSDASGAREEPSAPSAAEELFRRGAGAWLAQDAAAARASFETLIAEHPDHPLAWKAAMELEGHGPLARGLESYEPLPDGALAPSGQGTQCAPGVYSEAELWRRSLAYLVASQRADGGFIDSIYDFGGSDGLPNVHVAVTSIAAIAMMRGLDRLDAEADGALRARVARGLERALAFVADDANINEQDTDELVWAHVYRLRAAADAARREPPIASDLAGLPGLAERLVALQRADGSFAHEYPNPFVTANALSALFEASRVEPLQGLSDFVAAGTQSLLRCRTAEGAYTYNMVRGERAPRAAIEGSVGRTPVCELALAQWRPAESIGLAKAIALSFEHEHHLAPTRKYDDHTRNFAYGGFFYWYDIHARCEAIAALAPDDAARADFVARQRAGILALPEIDGTFIDSHEIGKSYGTAMALWCLATLDG